VHLAVNESTLNLGTVREDVEAWFAQHLCLTLAMTPILLSEGGSVSGYLNV
jgi:hypothetical protein